MDSQTKRTLLATALCLFVLIGWMKLMQVLYPPPPPAATSAPVGGSIPPAATASNAPLTGTTSAAALPPSSSTPSSEIRGAEFIAVGTGTNQPVMLGDARQNNSRTGFTNPYEMGLEINPRGAAVKSLNLSRHRNHPPKNRKNPGDDPYPLLREVEDASNRTVYDSFATTSVRLLDEKAAVNLDDVIWSVRKQAEERGESAVLQARVRRGGPAGEADFLEITKTYRLEQNSPFLRVSLQIRNLTDAARNVLVEQRGPVGLKAEDIQRDQRRVLGAVVDEETGQIGVGMTDQRPALIKAENGSMEILPGKGKRHLWGSVSNKYFACIVDPQAETKDGKFPEYVRQVFARALLRDEAQADDLTLEYSLRPGAALNPRGMAGDSFTMEFVVYCGAKNPEFFDNLPPALVARHYEVIRQPDASSCTFQFLITAMLWLLTHTYRLVHNYGIAIIILVIIVRLILHPVSKRGQINMTKMQKGMARLKPKMEAIQQQYKNDKTKLQEETMKLYREEGISQFAPMLSCLPMFLQMPIWVALWTTLNTDVNLRHQPFCLWITDLSSPDALIPFSASFNVPLIGSMMGPVSAFNLLPIIMVITMYLQQKLTQKLTAPATPAPQKLDKHGNPIPDQMAQQQKMMSFMTIFFGFLFYNFPAGLNLYILSSNLLGILEQQIIRREIKHRENQAEVVVRKATPTPGKPSIFSRYLEQLAKKAEDARRTPSSRSSGDDRRRDKTRN